MLANYSHLKGVVMGRVFEITDGDGRMAYHVTDVLFSRADGRMVIPPLLVHSASGTEDPKLTNDHTAHIFDATQRQTAGTRSVARRRRAGPSSWPPSVVSVSMLSFPFGAGAGGRSMGAVGANTLI